MATDANRRVRAPVLDVGEGGDGGDVAAATLRGALSSQLSPVLALEGHGLGARCAAVAAAASAAHAYSGDAQEAFTLEGVAGAAELRDALAAVARRALARLAPDFPAAAPLDVRLSLRRYPASSAAADADPGAQRRQRLGPHVDDTLCTLLWSTGPGLEVLAPADGSAWTGSDVARVGLPMMGAEPKVITDDDWAVVDWGADGLLFTPGHAWAGCSHTSSAVPLRSPTLHRVALPANGEERLSLPLLVSLRGGGGDS